MWSPGFEHLLIAVAAAEAALLGHTVALARALGAAFEPVAGGHELDLEVPPQLLVEVLGRFEVVVGGSVSASAAADQGRLELPAGVLGVEVDERRAAQGRSGRQGRGLQKVAPGRGRALR